MPQLEGTPSIPLSLDSSVGEDGEGSLSVIYATDKQTIAFDIANGDSEFLDIQFFDRNGLLLDERRLISDTGSSSISTTFIFTRNESNIAAITIDNFGLTTGGGLFDNFYYSN